MRILAIDAAGGSSTAGLLVDGLPVAGHAAPGLDHRAEGLIPRATDLLASAGLGFEDLDLLAVGVGPGTFTGSRAAVAAGRALALATGLPVMAVDTFAALAEIARPGSCGRPVAAVVDARRGQLALRLFGQAGAAPGPIELGEATALSGRLPADAVLAGPGAPALAAAAGRGHAVLHDGPPDAFAIGRCAERRLRAGEKPVPGSTLLPLYLRPPDARPAAGRPLVVPLPVGAGAC